MGPLSLSPADALERKKERSPTRGDGDDDDLRDEKGGDFVRPYGAKQPAKLCYVTI